MFSNIYVTLSSILVQGSKLYIMRLNIRYSLESLLAGRIRLGDIFEKILLVVLTEIFVEVYFCLMNFDRLMTAMF